MDTVTKRLYEGMFLVDSAEAASDWQGIQDAINKALAKGDAEVVSLNKWDERKLAYDINGKSRGTYLLCYFNAETDKIKAIERTVQLSEKIVRVMILRTDQMSEEDIKKDTPLMVVEAQAAAEAARIAEMEANRAAEAEAKIAEATAKADGAAAPVEAVAVESEPVAADVAESPADTTEETSDPAPEATEPETE